MHSTYVHTLVCSCMHGNTVTSTHIWQYTRTCVLLCVPLCTCTFVRMYAYVYVYGQYVRMCIRTCVPLCMPICTCTYVCTYVCTYSQTSLVSTPGDPPNCYSLSVVLANHID